MGVNYVSVTMLECNVGSTFFEPKLKRDISIEGMRFILNDLNYLSVGPNEVLDLCYMVPV